MISGSTSAHQVPWSPDQQTIPFPGLYDRDDDDASLTLPAFWEKFLLPVLRKKSHSHRTKGRTVVGGINRQGDPSHWERIMGPIKVAEMDANDAALARFQEALVAEGFSPETVNSYLGYVLQALNLCGPRDSRNKRGQGLIRYVPFVEPVPVKKRLPRIATLAELSKFYEACSVATWPSSRMLPAPLWWRVLYAICFSYGPRTGDAAPIKEKGSGLVWEEVRGDAACPIAQIELENPDGWFHFLPTKTDDEKPELLLPLTSTVRRHLDALPRAAQPAALVLPCTTHYDDFKQQRRAIESAAGLSNPITLQIVRRSSTSYWRMLDGDVAEYVTGHAARSVNARSYLNALIPLLERPKDGERMLDRFRYPDAFLSGP